MEAFEVLLKNLSSYDINDVADIIAKLVVTMVAVSIGIVVSRIAKKFVTKIVVKHNRFSSNPKTMASVTASIVSYLIIFFVTCNVLPVWGISASSIVAIGGAASLAIGVGAQDVIKDMLSGFFILSENQYVIGDVVTIDGYTGKVEAIGMRTTRIRSLDGNVHIIPNGRISVVTNMSKGFNRAIVDVGVTYDEDIDRVLAVLRDEMKLVYKNERLTGMIAEPNVLGVEELGDSSVVIRISTDCEIGENWQLERELRRIIKKRLEKEGIEIPFPQRVIHIKEEKDEH